MYIVTNTKQWKELSLFNPPEWQFLSIPIWTATASVICFYPTLNLSVSTALENEASRVTHAALLKALPEMLKQVRCAASLLLILFWQTLHTTVVCSTSALSKLNHFHIIDGGQVPFLGTNSSDWAAAMVWINSAAWYQAEEGKGQKQKHK